MKRKARLFIISLLAAIVSFGQSQSNYRGDEKDCPYLHPEYAKHTPTAQTLLIDDFENAETTYKQWTKGFESGNVKSDITVTDDAKEGAKAATITFTGEKTADSWTNLYCQLTLAEGHKIITFWAKAPKEVTVQLTLMQGAKHSEMEMYGHTLTIGTRWKLYHIKLEEVKEFIFSHLLQDGKPSPAKIINTKVTGIGFTEVAFPTTFTIDQLQIH